MAVTVSFDAVNLRSEFGTNTHTLGDQLAPDALGLSNGGFVVAYNNTSITSGLILLDFYDAAFQSVGAVSIPFDDSATTDAAGEPSVTELANGTVLVVWDEQNDTGSQAGIKGALFEQDGTVIDAGVNLEDGGIPYKDVDVTALSNGNFVVSFALSSFEMFQIYTSAGAQIGGSHIMNQVTAGTQRDAQLVALRDGGFAAVWTDVNTLNLKARIFENDGAPRTDEFAIHAFSGKSQVALAAKLDGGWVATYRDTAWGEPGAEGAGITLHMYDASGGGFSPIQVTDQTVPDESDPDVTVLSNGFILVTWTRPTGATNSDIMGRLFDQDGDAVEVNGIDGEFVITASASNDTLSSVAALAAGQFITAWQDGVTLDGSSGRITSEIAEIIRTSVGDTARNLIVGDVLRDVMEGGRAADTLDGADADDTLDGGEGNDSLLGQAGDDLIEGGARSDFIDGGDGDDRLFGSTETAPDAPDFTNSILGGAGDDVIVGGAGADTIRGGSGADSIVGGGDNDTIDGANFVTDNDTAANTLEGGGGDDLLHGADFSDYLVGGTGDDRLTPLGGQDTLDGGDGSDTASFQVGGQAAVVNLATGAMSGGAAGKTLISIENLFGSNVGDHFTGDDGANVLTGAAGNDTLIGADGDDRLIANSGFNVLTGGKGQDTLEAGLGQATLVYLSVRDTPNDPDKWDIIDAFIGPGPTGDRIDLSAIDARTGGKDNAFVLVASFTGAAGQLIAPSISPRRFLVQGDVDGDGVADFAIEVRLEPVNPDEIRQADFVL